MDYAQLQVCAQAFYDNHSCYFQSLYTSTPAFKPLVPVALLPYLALFLLLSTFTLGFYVSTYVRFAFYSSVLIHASDYQKTRSLCGRQPSPRSQVSSVALGSSPCSAPPESMYDHGLVVDTPAVLACYTLSYCQYRLPFIKRTHGVKDRRSLVCATQLYARRSSFDLMPRTMHAPVSRPSRLAGPHTRGIFQIPEFLDPLLHVFSSASSSFGGARRGTRRDQSESLSRCFRTLVHGHNPMEAWHIRYLQLAGST